MVGLVILETASSGTPGRHARLLRKRQRCNKVIKVKITALHDDRLYSGRGLQSIGLPVKLQPVGMCESRSSPLARLLSACPINEESAQRAKRKTPLPHSFQRSPAYKKLEINLASSAALPLRANAQLRRLIYLSTIDSFVALSH